MTSRLMREVEESIRTPLRGAGEVEIESPSEAAPPSPPARPSDPRDRRAMLDVFFGDAAPHAERALSILGSDRAKSLAGAGTVALGAFFLPKVFQP